MKLYLVLAVTISLVGCKKPMNARTNASQGQALDDVKDVRPDASAGIAVPSFCAIEDVEGLNCLTCNPRNFVLRSCFASTPGLTLANHCKLFGTTDDDKLVKCEADGKKVVELPLKKRNVEDIVNSIPLVSALARVVINKKIPQDKPEKNMALDVVKWLEENTKSFIQGDYDPEFIVERIETLVVKYKPDYASENLAKLKADAIVALKFLQSVVLKDEVNMASLMGLYAELGGRLPMDDLAKLFTIEDLANLLQNPDEATLALIQAQLNK